MLITHYGISGLGIILILFAFVPWYGFKYKGLGISGHYEKVLLPTTYLLLIYNLLTIYGLSIFTLNAILVLLFFFLISINFILLYYHFKDQGKTPPSYFAANLYLKDQKQQDHNKLN